MDEGTKRSLLAVACIAVAILLYWLTKPQPSAPGLVGAPPAAEVPQVPTTPKPSAEPVKPQSSAAPAPAEAAKKTVPATSSPPVASAAPPPVDPDGPPPASEPVATLPTDPTQDLEGVQTMMRDFRTALGGNPVGTNAEITSALLGDNLKQVKFSVPLGSSVNGNGELVDRWGTPYFFHQLSGREMEIRSAGPDRQMWTSDDRQVK